jgi:hypothetical protein
MRDPIPWWLIHTIPLDDFSFATLDTTRFAPLTSGALVNDKFTSVSLPTMASVANAVPPIDRHSATLATNPVAIVGIYRSIEIEWQSEQNRRYQAQWASSMVSDTWFDLGPPTLATGTNASNWDRVLESESRFYRVLSFQ